MIANVDEIKEIKADHAILGERKYSKVLEKYGDEMTALDVYKRQEVSSGVQNVGQYAAISSRTTKKPRSTRG